MRSLVASSLLLLRGVSIVALSTIASGCIVPLSLERDPTPNTRPSIVQEELDPPFGEPLVRPKTASFTFKIVADDPDLGDTLSARLLKADPNNPDGPRLALYTIRDLASTNDPAHPARRSGEFPLQRYCGLLEVVDNTPRYVYVRVTDAGFPNDSDDTTNGDHRYSDAFWVLTCN